MTTRTIQIPPWDVFQRTEDWRKEQEAALATAGAFNGLPLTAAARRVLEFEREWKAKQGPMPKGTPAPEPAPPPEPGPQMQQAVLFAAALRLARQNRAFEAMSGGGVQVHKLDRYVQPAGGE